MRKRAYLVTLAILGAFILVASIGKPNSPSNKRPHGQLKRSRKSALSQVGAFVLIIIACVSILLVAAKPNDFIYYLSHYLGATAIGILAALHSDSRRRLRNGLIALILSVPIISWAGPWILGIANYTSTWNSEHESAIIEVLGLAIVFAAVTLLVLSLHKKQSGKIIVLPRLGWINNLACA